MPDKPGSGDQSEAILIVGIIGVVLLAVGGSILHSAITHDSATFTLFAGAFLGSGLMCVALLSSAN